MEPSRDATLPAATMSSPAVATPASKPRYSVHGLEIGMSSAMVERLEGPSSRWSDRRDLLYQTNRHGVLVACTSEKLDFIKSDHVDLNGRCLIGAGDRGREVIAKMGEPEARHGENWVYPGLRVSFLVKERVRIEDASALSWLIGGSWSKEERFVTSVTLVP